MLEPQRWLLLLHQVPPSPPYLRAKILRRLKQIGALALKNSAYVLPDGEEAAEDFQWLLKEVRSDGGDAWVLRTEAVAGLTDESLRESFRELRSQEYRQLLAEAQSLDAQIRSDGTEKTPSPESSLRKLKKRYEEVVRIDFFEAPGRQEVVNLMSEIGQTLRDKTQGGAERVEAPNADSSGFQNRRWITRKGIKIDRTACCWLILRFIDPAAEFSFVDPNQYSHREGELRFDMFEGEFTHEGDRCSFEVLMDRCKLTAAALRAVAEIVHDLDLKDGKFGRPEAPGVAAMIEGLALRHADDAQRMRDGLVLFDALYSRLRAEVAG